MQPTEQPIDERAEQHADPPPVSAQPPIRGDGVPSFGRGKSGGGGRVAVVLLAVVMLCGLCDVASVFLVDGMVEGAVSKVQGAGKISVFMRDDVARADVDALRAAILADTDAVERVDYVSKDQALQRFKERTKDNPELMSQLRGNPLPASLEVTVADPDAVGTVAADIRKNPLLAKVIANPDDPDEDLRYGQEVAGSLLGLGSVIRVVQLAVGVLLAMVAAALGIVLVMRSIRRPA